MFSRRLREFAESAARQQKERLSDLMKQYLQATTCRRAIILNYFEEETTNLSQNRLDCCDICKNK